MSELVKALQNSPNICVILNPQTKVKANCFIWNVKAQRFHQASVAQIGQNAGEFILVYRLPNQRG